MNVSFVSLGCPRNLVDTETMLGLLAREGHRITQRLDDAHCVVINTCGFIQPAVEESIEVILEMAEWKKERPGRRLVVTGCLPQRYGRDLAKSLPEVDVFLGTGAFSHINKAVQGDPDDSDMILPPPTPLTLSPETPVRFPAGSTHVRYLKIAEGCSDHCTYCIIPTLRGRQHSRPMGEILAEAEAMAAGGVKECVLVAQNTTAYGQDTTEGCRLEELLDRLASHSGLPWIRILYGHPDYINDGLIHTIGRYDNICSYFDIPVQHISPVVLKRMGRGYDKAHIHHLFHRIRNHIPQASLRTTVMVGFPGETDKDVEMLLDFMETVRFDHLGAFIYSDDEDLPSHRLQDHIPEDVARQRYDRVMSLQATLSEENNRQYLGQTIQVLIDEGTDEKTGLATGRAPFQAPDIDGQVIVHGRKNKGDFAQVLISETDTYDLTGKAI